MSDTTRQWAYWDETDKRFKFIYPSKICVEMCFPDGGKHNIESGRGEIVEVEIRPLSKQEGFSETVQVRQNDNR